MGKGSKQRKSQVPESTVALNWNKCFSDIANKPNNYSLDVELDKQNERINRNKGK